MKRSRAGRSEVERRLADLNDAARRLNDPRAVHRLRVGLERLRTWAALADAPPVRKELRWAREKAAAVRDIDVCLALRPPPPIAVTLRRARPALQRSLEQALASRRFASAIEALRATRAPSGRLAARRVRRLIDDALAKTRAMGRGRWTARSVHGLRRALRRSRYALEWIGEPSGDLEPLQQALGAACDRRMAIHGLASDRLDERRYGHRLASELAMLLEAGRGRRSEIRTALKRARQRARRRKREEA